MKYEVRDQLNNTIGIFDSLKEASLHASLSSYTTKIVQVIDINDSNNVKEEIDITQPSFLTEQNWF